MVRNLSCTQTVITIASGFSMVMPQATYAQQLLAAQHVAETCTILDGAPIFQADARHAFYGKVRACTSGPYDITPPPFAPKAGEQLMLSYCRFEEKKPNGVVRARFNTPYLINMEIPYEAELSAFNAASGLPWDKVARIPPFLPTKIHDLGTQKGLRLYGYGGIVPLPSRASSAYPLDASSVIISIDGCAFNTPDALVAMMHSPNGKQYIEVTYYQLNERNRIFRRAFLPTYYRTDNAAEWAAMTRKYPVFSQDYSDIISTAATLAGIAGLVYMFSQTELGKSLARERAECFARNEGGIIC